MNVAVITLNPTPIGSGELLSRDELYSVGAYAVLALSFLALTMALNSDGIHNTSLPFALFLYTGLGGLGSGKNRLRKRTITVWLLMLMVSSSTFVAHWLLPERVNWYDGPMGFAVGAVLFAPVHYLLAYVMASETER